MRIKASTYQLMAALFALILSSSVATGSVEYHKSPGEGDSYSQGTLFCNDRIQVSFDATCIIELNADQILEGDPMGSYDDFILEVFEGTPPSLFLIPSSPLITYREIGKMLTVKVTDPETTNSCWSKVLVEDKLPPRLLCRDTTITCDGDPSPRYIGFPVPAGAVVVNTGSDKCPVYVFRGFDNCTDVELTYEDWVTKGGCDEGYDHIITRSWTAVDETGNESQCVQTIIVELSSLQDVGAPCDYDDIETPAPTCNTRRDDSKDFSPHILRWFEGCVDDYLVDQDVLDSTGIRLPMDSLGWNFIESGPYAGHPSPYSVYWEPHPDFNNTCQCWGPDEVIKWYGTGLPSGLECSNIQFAYQDVRLDIVEPNCDAGPVGCFKVLREWTILDWCTGEIAGHQQIIKVTDNFGPEVTYPEEVTVGMDVSTCKGTWDVPVPWITDNCSVDTRYEVQVLSGNVFQKADGQWRVTDLDRGIHLGYIHAYDCCGNVTIDTVILNVIDDVPPVAVCESHTTVSIPGGLDPDEAFAEMLAATLDDGSWDNCNPVWFKAVRMTKAECNELNGDDDPALAGYQEYPDNYVKFCCEDVGDTIMVRFLVFDRYPGPGPVNENLLRPGREFFGHYTECMVEVEVQDKVQPTVVAPPTIVASCDFWFDINKLNDPNDPTFGRIVTNLSDRGKVKTNDIVCPEWCIPNVKFNYFPPVGLEDKCALYDSVHPERIYEHLWGFDGYVLSSCGSMPTIIVNDQRECGQGRITRTISVPGGTGPVSATQTIYFVDCHPYFIEDENCFDFNQEDGIIWPCDLELNECEAESTPSVTGRPMIINDDNCSLVATKYEDWVFEVVPDACFKVIRKWTILDWCQYDPTINLTDGRWEYEQVILVNDGTPPELFGCGDVTFCDETAEFNSAIGACVGFADLKLDSVMDCSPIEDLVFEYKIDAFNDGIYDFISSEYAQVPDNNPLADDETNARDASGKYPIGEHRIVWLVEDMCGNVATCGYTFTIEDCKKPTPYCRTGIVTVVMPLNGEVEIWAEDLDIGSTDNCPGGLIFAFDSLGNELSRVFDCSQLGTTQIEMYVIDASGNYDYCTTTIEIQDPNDICSGTVTGGISGAIYKSQDNSAMVEVEIELFDLKKQTIVKQITSQSGSYAFANIPLGGEYVISAERNHDPMNGVSTRDLIAIQRHLLGQQRFTRAEEYIAADVNNTSSVTAKDLVELRKLILGLYSNFNEIDADQRSWRFVDYDHVFTDPFDPWGYPEIENFIPFTRTAKNIHFRGIKIGDVDGSASANAREVLNTRSKEILELVVEESEYSAGDNIRVAFKGENFKDITGYQYTLHFDSRSMIYAGVESGMLEVTNANFGLNRISEGIITTSWHNASGITTDEVLFTLVFRANRSGSISQTLHLDSDITRAEAYKGGGEEMDVQMNIKGKTNPVFMLNQNSPNPFSDETIISFILPEELDVQLTVFDLTGKVLRIVEMEGQSGYNEVILKGYDIHSSGVLFYQLNTGEYTATKRMVKVSSGR